MNIPFKITYNTILQLLAKTATAASQAAILFLIAHYFPLGSVGSYTVILSFVALFYIFTDFGFNAIYVREAKTDGFKQKEYFQNLLALRLIVSGLASFIAVAILAFTFYPPMVKLGILIALPLIIGQSATLSVQAIFQAKIRYSYVLIYEVIWAFARLMLVYLVAISLKTVFFLMIALVISEAIRVLVALYLVRFQIGNFTLIFNTGSWRRLVFQAWPVGLILVFSQFNAQVDKQIVLLANYRPSLGLSGELAADIYGMAYKLFEIAIILPTFIMNTAYPIMVRRWEEGVSALVGFTKRLVIIMLLLGFVAFAAGWLAVPFILDFFGAGKFAPSVLTARVLLFGFPLFFITPITLWLAITLDKAKELMFIYGFVAAFNFVSNLIFVPTFGYNAAAIITVVSELLIFLLSLGVLYLGLKGRANEAG